MFTKALAFEDVLLKPAYSDIVTRADIDLNVDMGRDVILRLPIIASPMDSIMSPRMARRVYEAGGIGVLHRYQTIEEQCKEAEASDGNVMAAVGVTGDYFERVTELVRHGIAGICIDVAHGHHDQVGRALEKLRAFCPGLHIMAGNVATLEGFNYLAARGADSIRVGIGGGSICSTRIQTGHGIPTLQSVLECSESEYDVALIADGGIKTSGDIVKALAAGADAVMLGSLLSGTQETPGAVIKSASGETRKIYRGMASPEAQLNWRGRYSSNEGVSRTVPFRGPVTNVLFELDKGVRSGLSYSGARSVRELQAKAKFIVQTTAGAKESSTHIDG